MQIAVWDAANFIVEILDDDVHAVSGIQKIAKRSEVHRAVTYMHLDEFLKGLGTVPQETTNEETKRVLLKQLRTGVQAAIQLREVMNSMTKVLDWKLGVVSELVTACSVVADTGMELTSSDLDEFLDLSKGCTRSGTPLTPDSIQ